ncbi:MAG TPA: RNB domain-containing ribonuclease [Propionibacteriaceae bacterium]|jgi:exoribonuclease R|nr:RNB domain-containing ribonuclease [Propionibacteriaceae bacterium]
MVARKLGLPPVVPEELAKGLAAIRATAEVPSDFAVEVEAAAEKAAAEPRLPDLDRTDLELITIDPAGSRDLDQALHIARGPRGEFVISYAIADVAAFVQPGDPIDLEAHRRGTTLYAPDCRTPLHPSVLSEGAASLLPNEVRPALLWTITLDHRGQTIAAEVARAKVRSHAQLSYSEAQVEIDWTTPRETLGLLKLVGQWREIRERDRGGVSLKIPQQEIQPHGDGWTLGYRAPEPVEGWNAQISLLAGMAAADIMLYGQVGILRTMPPADSYSLRRLHQVAKALRIVWPPEMDYADFARTLNPARPDQAAMLNASTLLFRGAGYRSFSGGIPENVDHAALASDYAHTTAPLRRLVDRYSGEICVALCADQPVPAWVLRALDGLPEQMATAERRAKKYERAIIDLLEVYLLADKVGQTFTATVIDVDRDKQHGTVMIEEPAVEGRVTGDRLRLGQEVLVRLTSANYDVGAVAFEVARTISGPSDASPPPPPPPE